MGKEKNRFELVYFIIITLLQISYDSGNWYCYCEKFKKY